MLCKTLGREEVQKKKKFWRAVFPRQSSFFKNVTFWRFSAPGTGDPIWESILWMFHVFLLKAWFLTNVSHFSLKKARQSMRTKKWKENELKHIFRSNKRLNIGIKTWKQTQEKQEWQSNVMLKKKKKKMWIFNCKQNKREIHKENKDVGTRGDNKMKEKILWKKSKSKEDTKNIKDVKPKWPEK